MKDIFSDLNVVNALNNTSISTNTTTNGASIDLQGYEGALIIFRSGSYTNGSFAPNIQESDDGSTWTDAPADVLLGAETAIAAADTIRKIGYVGYKRYIRPQVISTGVSGAGILTAFAIRGHARNLPVA